MPMQARLLIATLATVLSGTAQAKLVEQQLEVPVHVTNAWGKAVAQPIRVTVFFNDETPSPHPVLIINHGRAVDAEGRAALGRAR
jgi:hypothetical protein